MKGYTKTRESRIDQPAGVARVRVPPHRGTGSWDLSHARRFVQVFHSLIDHRDVLGDATLND